MQTGEVCAPRLGVHLGLIATSLQQIMQQTPHIFHRKKNNVSRVLMLPPFPWPRSNPTRVEGANFTLGNQICEERHLDQFTPASSSPHFSSPLFSCTHPSSMVTWETLKLCEANSFSMSG